jgi:hypothetical protein
MREAQTALYVAIGIGREVELAFAVDPALDVQ